MGTKISTEATPAGRRAGVITVEGITWTCVRPGSEWTAEYEGVRFQLERRTRNVNEGCEAGWYLYGGDHVGECLAKRFKEAAAGASPLIRPKADHPQLAVAVERFPVESAAVYVTEENSEEYRDVVIVKSTPDADGLVKAISSRYNGKGIRVAVSKLQPLPVLPPTPEGEITGWWTITDVKGAELARVEAEDDPGARKAAMRHAAVVAAVRRDKGFAVRRLRTSELSTPVGELRGLPRVSPSAAQTGRTITVTTGFTRKSIPTRLRESGTPGRMVNSEAAGGALRWRLPDGEELTPGEAATRFLGDPTVAPGRTLPATAGAAGSVAPAEVGQALLRLADLLSDLEQRMGIYTDAAPIDSRLLLAAVYDLPHPSGVDVFASRSRELRRAGKREHLAALEDAVHGALEEHLGGRFGQNFGSGDHYRPDQVRDVAYTVAPATRPGCSGLATEGATGGRVLTPDEHSTAWHAVEGAAGEEGADPGTILHAVLRAVGITAPSGS